jgi:hypothetical protein
MRLPVELRAMIFTYAVQGHTWTYHPPFLFPGHHTIALLSICRQIYAETATLPFAINTLNLGWIETNNYLRDSFLAQRTDAQLGAARSVHLRSSAYSPTGPKLIHRALSQLPGLWTVYLTYGAHKFVLTAEDGRVMVSCLESALEVLGPDEFGDLDWLSMRRLTAWKPDANVRFKVLDILPEWDDSW